MDLSDNGPNSRPHESRPNVEAHPPQTLRLQKKRSNAGNRTTISQQPSGPRSGEQRYSVIAREGDKARKGSLRNAVRRIFGRRSRAPEPEPELEPEAGSRPVQASPSRHGYHRSEPTGLPLPAEVPEGPFDDSDWRQRTFSAPLELLPSSLPRTRSPYAVEFPQSARLKPLKLASPFSAPGSQLRRRRTLPSILISGDDAAAVAGVIGSPAGSPGLTAEEPRDPPHTEIGRTLSTNKSEKRKSRSADNLRRADLELISPPRKRSDEIKYWRESFQRNVLRASGFTVSVPREDGSEPGEDDKTPMAKSEDPFVTHAGPSGISPGSARRRETTEQDFASPSAFGSQLSQDLEDRIARLEAGLHSFRGELAQIAADRNRRTILVGRVPTPSIRRRASSGGRTASMLAETLALDLEPSTYHYGYNEAGRPSTSPQPPSTPPRRYTGPSALPNFSTREPRAEPARSRSPSPPPPPPQATPGASINHGDGGGGRQQAPPQHTFRSLYEMLSDERSARRRLEMQMRGLREEISNLHYQVSVGSNIQSQRSSYQASMDPRIGSSRLHALLQGTEDSPSGTARSNRQRDSRGIITDPRIVSRFSGSESEAGMPEYTELETPYEAYQTPVGEHESFPFAEQARTGTRAEDVMF